MIISLLLLFVEFSPKNFIRALLLENLCENDLKMINYQVATAITAMMKMPARPVDSFSGLGWRGHCIVKKQILDIYLFEKESSTTERWLSSNWSQHARFLYLNWIEVVLREFSAMITFPHWIPKSVGFWCTATSRPLQEDANAADPSHGKAFRSATHPRCK